MYITVDDIKNEICFYNPTDNRKQPTVQLWILHCKGILAL